MPDQSIIKEIAKALSNINYGSVEVIVQNGQVTQISTRIIKKTNLKNGKSTMAVVKKENAGSINLNFKY